jgi:nucleoside-diphosphate-sugar epimerase
MRVAALVMPHELNSFISDPNLTLITGDLEKPCNIYEKLSGMNFDTMYHLAWTGVDSACKNDYSIQIKNIEFAFSVMELAKKLGCGHVICPGSISEYAYTTEAVNGKQLPAPADVYAATKVAVHTYCDLIARQSDISLNWVLIPSIYGPGREDSNLITYSIKTLLAGGTPSYTKLEQMWDYIYIDDLIRAMFLVGEFGRGIKTYVAASGKARVMREYVELIRDAIDPTAQLGIGDKPYKLGSVDNAICDISELRRETGFNPTIEFEAGIQITIDYYRQKMQRD